MLHHMKHICVLGLFVSVVGCQGAGFSTSGSGLSFGADAQRRGEAAKSETENKKDQDASAPKSEAEKSAQAYQLPVQWPPNHRMERFTLETIPNESDLSVCKIASIGSSEVDKSAEADDLADDYKILDALVFEVRIERLGAGEGRAYSITVVCGVEGEESREHVFEVSIPHDWRDQGQSNP